MTETVIFLSVGLGFLAALMLWVGRTATPAPASEAAEKAQEVLAAAQLELPSRALGERIFALEDCEFVARQVSGELQRQFLRERKAIALCWLSRTRKALQYMMAFHRKAVRGNAQLNPAAEARLALSYFSFLLVYDLLFVLIWLRGPFAARAVVSYTASTAEQLSYLSAQALASMDPARLSKIQSSLPGRAA